MFQFFHDAFLDKSLIHCIAPVSYTHLDVYKRQCQLCAVLCISCIEAINELFFHKTWSWQKMFYFWQNKLQCCHTYASGVSNICVSWIGIRSIIWERLFNFWFRLIYNLGVSNFYLHANNIFFFSEKCNFVERRRSSN